MGLILAEEHWKMPGILTTIRFPTVDPAPELRPLDGFDALPSRRHQDA